MTKKVIIKLSINQSVFIYRAHLNTIEVLYNEYKNHNEFKKKINE